jgi:hypothetical protein
MSRPWEQALRKDEVAWADFLAWLDELKQRELERMLAIPPAEHEYQRGVHNGIDAVRYAATAQEKEDEERARRFRT